MTDQFEDLAAGLESPAAGAFDITPDDTALLPAITRALYIGVGGTVSFEMKWGGTVSFHNVPDGALLPIRAVKVLAQTTAASIVGLY